MPIVILVKICEGSLAQTTLVSHSKAMKHPRLIYLMGASGVGKDSLLNYLRAHSPCESPLFVARRFITRAAGSGIERHVPVSHEEFQRRLDHGHFSMHWDSHGHSYGIGREVETALAEGRCVIVNGSRAYLAEAAKRFPELLPVLVQAKPEIIRKRLIQRDRETIDGIQKRIRQNQQLNAQPKHPSLILLDNNGDLHIAGEKLISLIRNLTLENGQARGRKQNHFRRPA